MVKAADVIVHFIKTAAKIRKRKGLASDEVLKKLSQLHEPKK